MKYRTALLYAATSIVPAGTTVIDLKSSDIISRITAIIRLTNNSWVPTGHPAVAMINLQLLDGSDVLHSLTGPYSQAMSFYSSMNVPYNNVCFTPPGNARATVPIYFGRHLWDPMFALDPKRFRNLQLKIQHNYLLGGAVPNAATLEVWIDYFDDNPPSPVGFLMAKSLWTHTMVAASTDYVLLPQDSPIRLLCPAVFSNTEEPDVNLNNFRLSENGDKRILLDIDTMNHIRINESMYPDFFEVGDGRTNAAANTLYFGAPEKNFFIHVNGSTGVANDIKTPWGGGGGRNIFGSATQTVVTKGVGRCPFGVVPINFGCLEEPDTWWDVTKAVAPRIMLVTGAPGVVSPDYELLVQQARSY